MKVRNAMAAKLQKKQPKRVAQFKKISKLAQEGKFQEAENILIPIEIEGPMRKMRAGAANQEIDQVIARIKPDPAAMDVWERARIGRSTNRNVMIANPMQVANTIAS